MTNQERPEDGDRTVAPRDADDTVIEGTAAGAADPEPAPQVSLEEAGLQDDGLKDTVKTPKGEGGGARAVGVALIVLLTLVAAVAGAALGPLIRGGGESALVAFESRIAALEQRLGGLDDLGSQFGAVGEAAKALETRVAALEARPAATAGDGAAATTDPDLAARVAALEQATSAIATRVEGTLDARIEQLAAEVASLQQDASAAAGGGTTADNSALAAELDGLKQTIAELGTRLDGLQATASGDIAPLESRLDGLAGRVDELAKTATEVASLQQEVATLASRATDPRAAFALAAGQLREDVLAGNVYDDALRTATSLAPDDAQAKGALAALEPWRTTGVATRQRLADALSATAFVAVDAARTAAAQGWFDKTMAELASLVTVRRVDGEDGATDADSVTARAEARLRQGDLAGAIAEMASLQGEAATAAAGWLEMARARQAAEQAVDTLSARAIALVGGAAG